MIVHPGFVVALSRVKRTLVQSLKAIAMWRAQAIHALTARQWYAMRKTTDVYRRHNFPVNTTPSQLRDFLRFCPAFTPGESAVLGDCATTLTDGVTLLAGGSWRFGATPFVFGVAGAGAPTPLILTAGLWWPFVSGRAAVEGAGAATKKRGRCQRTRRCT